jgi:hypothetical protein
LSVIRTITGVRQLPFLGECRYGGEGGACRRQPEHHSVHLSPPRVVKTSRQISPTQATSVVAGTGLLDDGREVAIESRGSIVVNDALYAWELALPGVGLAYQFESPWCPKKDSQFPARSVQHCTS